jgi:hypothetical protein
METERQKAYLLNLPNLPKDREERPLSPLWFYRHDQLGEGKVAMLTVDVGDEPGIVNGSRSREIQEPILHRLEEKCRHNHTIGITLGRLWPLIDRRQARIDKGLATDQEPLYLS